ncbi:MAG: hypothetical protein M4579_004965 [Chaenotheca gracillima]|nr:MAG: hypothetical protein M4579_004965 [Chaenotheca gracillima]
MDRDDASKAISDFCSQDKLVLKAKSDPITKVATLGETIYSPVISWIDGCENEKDTPISHDECASTLQDLIDGCPDFQDVSKKHGGSIDKDNCYHYEIYGSEPTKTLADPSINPSPIKKTRCYPSHDSDKPLQRLGQGGISSTCKGSSNPYQLGGGGAPSVPSNNNLVRWEYKQADDVPSYCDHFMKDKLLDGVLDSCTDPFEQIMKDCPNQGGDTENECGWWSMQTCALGGPCAMGDLKWKDGLKLHYSQPD